MSSYIIAGSADSLETALCEEIARKIKAKYKNIDFRIVIKHPSEWEQYLNQICRIYGFLHKTNPIIYTYHGKIIGNKDAFIESAIKYFGFQEDKINFGDVSTKVNIKLANEELECKRIEKNKIRTLSQKINDKFKNLLKQGIFKHRFKDNESFLVHGVQYYFREVENLCPEKKFIQFKEVTIEKQEIQPASIDLMVLSQQDQIQPEEGAKDTFLTNNQGLNTDSMEKMSQASRRTNRIQSSVMSKDGDSKHNKESNMGEQQIQEEFDDVVDYTDVNMQDLCIFDLGDNFYLSFQKQTNTHITGEMLIYYSEAQNNMNCIRIYHDGRGVLGHHPLIKQIHYIYDGMETKKTIENQSLTMLREQGEQIENDENKEEENKKEEGEEDKQNEENKQNEEHKEKNENEEELKEEKKEETEQKIELEQIQPIKARTNPSIPLEQENNTNNIQNFASEIDSNLNLVSHLNYHTLYILKPLSANQINMILYVVAQTDAVACLQFLPENPNPKIKVYNRTLLLGKNQSLFPVEKFIEKQIEDQQIEEITLTAEGHMSGEEPTVVKVRKVNGLNFTHFIMPLDEEINGEEVAKRLKIMIDEVLNLEQILKKQIGYNLVFGKKYIMIVALTEPYKVYGSSNLYFDGLAYLGFVHLAKVVEGYALKECPNKEKFIPDSLAKCSGFQICQ